MSVDRSPAGFSVTAALQASRLGTSSLVFFAVAAAAPLTVVAGAVTTGYATVGLVGLPAAYLVMTVVLLIWTVGYTALSRQVVPPGPCTRTSPADSARPPGSPPQRSRWWPTR